MNTEVVELEQRWPLCHYFKLPVGHVSMVAGSYTGLTMQLLAEMYPGHSAIIGFEPQDWARKLAKKRLQQYPRMVMFPFGIGTVNGTYPMGEWETDGCSFVNIGSNARVHGVGQMREFNQLMAELNIDKIDLAVINMEGYEYTLLPYLHSMGWYEKIDRIAIQFHEDWDYDSGYGCIIEALDASYLNSFHKDLPGWGYWER